MLSDLPLVLLDMTRKELDRAGTQALANFGHLPDYRGNC